MSYPNRERRAPVVFVLGILAVVLFSAAAWAGEGSAPALTLLSFSQKVQAYYPKLKAARNDVDIALAQQMQARAGFWPSLDLSAGYKVSDDPVNVFGMLLRQERFTSADFDLKRLNSPARHQDLSGGIHVELPLFDALQTIYRTRAARGNLKAAEADEAFTQMEAWLMAQDAYLNAVTLERSSVVIDEVWKSSDEDLQKASDLKARGMILGADYYAARVMFGDVTRMKNEIARQKKAMTALLNILMGEPVDQAWTLAPSIKEGLGTQADVRELMAAAMANRLDLAAFDLRLKAFDAQLAQANSTGLPHISVFGDATNDRDKITTSGGNNYTVGLKAQMPLFDPARNGRVREVKAHQERLAHDIQLFKDGISRDITGEAARQDALRDNLEVLKGMTADAKEAMALMVPLYSEGRKSIKDIVEIRRAYLASVQGYDKALMDAWLSQGRLLFLTGRLNADEMEKLAEGAGL